jgi:hypothetical protein
VRSIVTHVRLAAVAKVGLVALIAVAALIAASGADANEGWLGPLPATAQLGSDGTSAVSTSAPSVAVSSSGDTVVAWQQSDNTIQVAVRPSGATTFAPPVQVGDAMSVGPPAVTIDAAGNAVVAFQHSTMSSPSVFNYTVQAAFRLAGGQFGPATDIGGSTYSQPVRSISAAFTSATDSAVVAWIDNNGIAYSLRNLYTSSAFAPTQSYAVPAPATVPSLAITSSTRGGVALAWTQTSPDPSAPPGTTTTDYQQYEGDLQDGPPSNGSLTATAIPGATSSYSVMTTPSGTSGSRLTSPVLAADQAGDVVVAWFDAAVSGPSFVRASYLPGTGSFQATPDTLDTLSGSAVANPSAAMLPSGTAVVAWDGPADGVHCSQRLQTDSAFPATPQVLGSASTLPQLTAGNNEALMTYIGGNGIEMGAVVPDGGSTGAGIALSSGTVTHPALAGDIPMVYGGTGEYFALPDSSDGVAVWLQDDGADTRVESAAHDAGPRVMLPIPFPWGSVTPDTPVTFDTGVFDPFSPITSINWNFGDGATGTGQAPTHSYSTAGVFNLEVTATDAAGLISSPEGGTFDVIAPSAPKLKPSAPKLRLSSGSAKIDPTTGRGTLSVTCVAPARDHCLVHGSLYGPGTLPAHASALTVRTSSNGNKRATKHPKIAARVGAATGTIRAAKTGTIRIKLSRAELKRLKTEHRLTVRLIATITDHAGGTSLLRTTVKLSLKARPKRQHRK